MSIIKEKIQFTGRDINIKLNFGGGNNLYGYDQEVNSLLLGEANESINPYDDNEVLRFSLAPKPPQFTGETRLFLEFYSSVLDEYSDSLLYAGFTENEVRNYEETLRNSFFIFDFYNNFNQYNQDKIVTRYFTKVNIVGRLGRRRRGDNVSGVTIVNIPQVFYMNLPMNYLNETEDNILIGYLSIKFFNSKRSKLYQFYNNDFHSGTAFLTNSPERMYFKTIINKENKTWTVDTPSMQQDNPMIHGRELITSQAYIDKIDNTLDKLDNIKQQYPLGDAFDYRDQTYVDS